MASEAPTVEYRDALPPFWTKVEGVPHGPERRVAALDLFSPGYAPPKQRLSEQAIAVLQTKGLTEDGAHAIRQGFGAGNLSDLGDIATLGITRGGFIAIQCLPSNDPGQGECNACPYLGGMFGRDPASIDVTMLPELGLTEDGVDACVPAVVTLLNERGRRMRGEGLIEQRQFRHDSLREFAVRALRLAYFQLTDESVDGHAFRAYCAEHLRPGDRLLDYTAFQTLQQLHGNPWWAWPDAVKRSDPQELVTDEDTATEIEFWLYVQWRTGQQWEAYAERVHDAGGYTIMDRAYSVLPDNPEAWRSWREQYVEWRPGLFHIAPNGEPSYGSGANVEGDPYGAQGWGHLVLDFQDNPDGAIEFIVETIRPMAEIADVIRIDHALAWIWKYYRIPAGRSAKEGEYLDALKHRIFQRIREEFPDLYIICEDCGYTDDAVDRTLEECGADAMACLHWSPRGDDLNPRYAHPDAGPVKRVWITDNHDTAAIEKWFFGLRLHHQLHFMRMMYGNARVLEGQTFSVKDFVSWIFGSNKHIVVTTLRTMSALAEHGQKDDRPLNVPGTEHPSFWQLVCRCLSEDVERSFEVVASILGQTRRSAHSLVHDDGKPRVLALTPRAGEQVRVRPGGEARIRIALTHPPKDAAKIHLRSNTPWSTKSEDDAWGSEQIGDVQYKRYRDGTYVCELTIRVPATASAGAFEIAGELLGDAGASQPLCAFGENIKLVVERSH